MGLTIECSHKTVRILRKGKFMLPYFEALFWTLSKWTCEMLIDGHRYYIRVVLFISAASITLADEKNDNVAVLLWADGKIFYSVKYILRNYCSIVLTHFPFDRHTCLVGFPRTYFFETSARNQNSLNMFFGAFSSSFLMSTLNAHIYQ